MRILFTGDWQTTSANLSKCHRALDHMCAVIKRENITAVVHLGDVKDAYNPVDQRVTNFLVEFVSAIPKACELVVLRGNHDQIGMHESTGSCMPVLAAAGATVFTEPDVVKFRAGSVALAAVPFRRDTEDLIKDFELVRERSKASSVRVHLLAFHNEIVGAQYNNTRSIDSGLRRASMHVDDYALVVGGHIHKAQRVAPNVYYAGSPFAHDWGETNQRKSFLIYDTQSKKVSFVYSKIPGYYDPNAPGFDSSKPRSFAGAHVRSVVLSDGTSAVAGEIDREKARLEREYKGATPVVNVERIKDLKTAVDVSGTMSDDELVEAYLKRNCPAVESAAKMTAYLLYKMANTGTLRRSFEGLQFLKARGHNVLSFEDVEFDYGRRGTTLITGYNADWEEQIGRAHV